MMALSIKQPWASMIAKGEKTIETRKWKTDYRGSLLIVSSKDKYNDYLCGYALAVANLTDCRPMTKEDESGAKCEQYAGAYAWILTDVKLITPFQVRGQLGLYEVQII